MNPQRSDAAIGVDVGGTKIAAGVVAADGTVIEMVRLPTPPHDPQALEQRIGDAVIELSGRHPVAAVGLAVAGFVDEKRSLVRFAPNLSVSHRPLRESVGARVGLRVVVENDANAAAWGEVRFGAGQGSADVLMITVGTGLGGGIVLDGRLVRGAFGGAGEFGHVRMVPGGLLCGCGKRGCWEQYASGSALVRRTRELVAADPAAGRVLLALADGDAAQIRGTMITEAARQGDPVACEALAEVGRWLGEGIADLADVLDPEVVVIGGGVSQAGDLLLDPARQAYAEHLTGAGHRPRLRIVSAALGNDAGLIGAADLARVP
ncbi:MAG: ROK family glucokinase [Kineosporiaceae bacterium]